MRDLLGDVAGIGRSVGFRVPDGELRVVAGQQIVRDNMPFGSIGKGEFGTYFIAYASDPGVTEQMLRNMFVGRPPGNYDRILDFSTAVTGSLFFVPSADLMDDLPPLRSTSSPGGRS